MIDDTPDPAGPKKAIERLMSAELPPIITPRQLEEVMQLGRTTVYELLRSGAVPGAYRIGPKLYRINTRVLLESLGKK
jgi:hypothetical protein